MNAFLATLLPWLLLYLAAGVVTLLIAASSPLRAWLRQRREPDSLLSLMESMDPRSYTLWYRTRARVLAPLLTAIAVVLLWPGAPWMKFREWMRDREMARFHAAQVFKVRSEYLLEKLNIEDVEAREIVQDPLHAVPTEPFGHLHAVWAELIEKLKPRDELWSFRAEWHDRWGVPDLRTGYVIWRRGRPVGHILTLLKSMEDVSAQQTSSHPVRLTPSTGEIEIPDFLRRQADTHS